MIVPVVVRRKVRMFVGCAGEVLPVLMVMVVLERQMPRQGGTLRQQGNHRKECDRRPRMATA